MALMFGAGDGVGVGVGASRDSIITGYILIRTSYGV